MNTIKYYDDIGYRKGSGSNLACSDKAAALLSVLKTQCAWCNRYMTDGTAYGNPLTRREITVNPLCPTVEIIRDVSYNDLDASHGICDSCYKIMMKSDEGGQG